MDKGPDAPCLACVRTGSALAEARRAGCDRLRERRRDISGGPMPGPADRDRRPSPAIPVSTRKNRFEATRRRVRGRPAQFPALPQRCGALAVVPPGNAHRRDTGRRPVAAARGLRHHTPDREAASGSPCRRTDTPRSNCRRATTPVCAGFRRASGPSPAREGFPSDAVTLAVDRFAWNFAPSHTISRVLFWPDARYRRVQHPGWAQLGQSL